MGPSTQLRHIILSVGESFFMASWALYLSSIMIERSVRKSSKFAHDCLDRGAAVRDLSGPLAVLTCNFGPTR
jgi:hypothetical protein